MAWAVQDSNLRPPARKAGALPLSQPPRRTWGTLCGFPVPELPLTELFRETRERTERLIRPLEPDDLASGSPPAKWRLGRTTWFLETHFLGRDRQSRIFAEPPPCGGFPRPTVAEILDYRHAVDREVRERLEAGVDAKAQASLGLALLHEEEQLESLLAGLKRLFSASPLAPPVYPDLPAPPPGETPPLRFLEFPGGTVDIGRDPGPFVAGAETPRHQCRVDPFRIASRLVTNREYLEFVEDGGYREERIWLRDGWRVLSRERPAYWTPEGEEYTLGGGLQPLALDAPVAHLSFFEADAFARWRERRLPTEFEWEAVASALEPSGNLLESGRFAPLPAGGRQMYGDVWEWTLSGFEPWPGTQRPPEDFSPGRMAVRGGSCLTSGTHLRASSRRGLRPMTRWHCTGIRLARAA